MWHTVLGAFEAGFAASLIFYLTTFYTRGEQKVYSESPPSTHVKLSPVLSPALSPTASSK